MPTNIFWNLIAWHKLTHAPRALKIQQYDERAKDIWEAVTTTKKESGHEKLCWAADRTLLDIIIDVLGCTKELFSNILNTYHRFQERRSLYAHPSFAQHAKLYIDGLATEAFTGCAYGNPPFDGQITNNDTINKLLDKAEHTCNSNTPFIGIFYLPLSPQKLAKRLEFSHVSLLMKFPNDTVSFIPDSHWYGGNFKPTGCYNQDNTNMVLLRYENENNSNSLPVMTKRDYKNA